MTLSEYMDALHYLYEGNVDTPTSSDDEYTHRTKLLEMAINAWDNDYGMRWRELWVTLADASDGDKTVGASDVDYDMPTDFRFLGGFVRTYTTATSQTYWNVFDPAQADLYKNESTTACYVTGNKSAGFDLHFLKQPTAGDTIDYPYYKEPSYPTSASEVIEMSDPWFAVYFALAKLHEIDGDGDRAALALNQAQQKLTNMRVQNELAPGYEKNPVQDTDVIIGEPGFGGTD